MSIAAVFWGKHTRFEWLSEPTPGKILSKRVGQSTWVLEHNLGGDLLSMCESSKLIGVAGCQGHGRNM